jgi:SAM-dependent methyltransferase
VTTKHGKLTGERPHQGATPDSLLALHDAGYRAVISRLGAGRVLDVGCGQGFESVRLGGVGRDVVGVDYNEEAASAAGARPCLLVCRMDAQALGFGAHTFPWICSSHLIEHFAAPERHVAEVARVLADGGSAFFVTPNAPADFENPFHVHPFGAAELTELLARHFGEVWVRGIDAVDTVKAAFEARRAKARRVLALDVLDLRHRMPRAWYLAAYSRLLPIAYRLMAGAESRGTSGGDADDWFVTEEVDDSTLVLFAVCRSPKRGGRCLPSG